MSGGDADRLRDLRQRKPVSCGSMAIVVSNDLICGIHHSNCEANSATLSTLPVNSTPGKASQ
jgi:hypothetical protein